MRDLTSPFCCGETGRRRGLLPVLGEGIHPQVLEWCRWDAFGCRLRPLRVMYCVCSQVWYSKGGLFYKGVVEVLDGDGGVVGGDSWI